MHFICQKDRIKICLSLNMFSTNQHPKIMAPHKFPKFNLHIPSLHHSGSGTHPRSRRCHHQAHRTWRACCTTSLVCPTAWETHRHSQIKSRQVLKLTFQTSFEVLSFPPQNHEIYIYIYIFFTEVHFPSSSWVETNGQRLRFPRGHMLPGLIKVNELDNEMLRLCQKLGFSKLIG